MGRSLSIENRKARRDYEILETLEAGMALKGYEVKSLREGRANLTDAYARVEEEQVFLYNLHISPYQANIAFSLDPLRPRKLLLKREEIRRLIGKVQEKGLTLIPLKIYFNSRGFAKVLLALGKGRRKEDRREKLKKKEDQREMERALKYGKFLLLLVLLGHSACTHREKPKPFERKENRQATEKKRERSLVSLYYLNAKGDLVVRRRPVPLHWEQVFAWLKESEDSLTSPLPRELSARRISRKGEMVVVDLLGSSLNYPRAEGYEALWVRALVFTFTSLPGIRKVQLLEDGKKIDALPSGLEVREPLTRSSFQ